MAKFNVPLKRTVTDYAWVEVEAKTASAAKRAALKQAREDDGTIDWCDSSSGRIVTNGRPEGGDDGR